MNPTAERIPPGTPALSDPLPEDGSRRDDVRGNNPAAVRVHRGTAIGAVPTNMAEANLARTQVPTTEFAKSCGKVSTVEVPCNANNPVIVPSTSTPSAPPRSAVVLAFAAIYLIWGSTYLGIRVAIETMPPFAMAGARFIIAGATLFAFLRFRGTAAPTARQWRINLVIGTFLMLGGNGLVVWAEQFVPSGVTALMIGVQPLFFVLTEWAWPGGSRPTATTGAALLLGFSGVAWLAAPWENSAQGGLSIAGVTAILGACVFWALGSIYSRHARHDADPFLASSLQMLGGGAALMIAALLHGDFSRLVLGNISARSWGAFIYLIGCGSLVAFSAFVWLIKHSTPARVSTYAYVNPIVAVFLGWLILREPVLPRTMVASVVIIAAVVIITVQKNQAARKSA